MTIASDNVAAFATRALSPNAAAVRDERYRTTAAAMQQLVDGNPGAAYYALLRGVRRQWLLTGTGELQLGPEPTPSEIIAAWDKP